MIALMAVRPDLEEFFKVKFLNFLHPDPWKIIQLLGTEAKPSALSNLNFSQPCACQKAFTEKHRQLIQPVL